ERQETAIEVAEAKRTAELDTRAQTAGMTLDEKLDFNRAEAKRNQAVEKVIGGMRNQASIARERLPRLKGKATKLRNQLALRKKEFELQEEANKRTKRTEARIMLGARALMV